MTVRLPESAREQLDGQCFPVLSTLLPDGSPHLTVVWAKHDGDDVLVSTVEGRRKHKNLLKDPRLSMILNPPGNPYNYVEIRGTASMTTKGGRELINELSNKYMGKDYDMDGPDDVRVVIRITPRKIVERR